MFNKLAAFLFAAGTGLSFNVQVDNLECPFFCERMTLDWAAVEQPACLRHYKQYLNQCLRQARDSNTIVFPRCQVFLADFLVFSL